MQWNQPSAMMTSANTFYANCSQPRQTMLKRAFGQLGSKMPLRFRRDEKGAKIDAGHAYQEDLMEVRIFLGQCIELWAERIGATKSQAFQALITGREEPLVRAIKKAIDKETTEQLKDEKYLNPQLKRVIYKDKLRELTQNDISTVVVAQWIFCVGVMTSYEQEAAGKSAAYTTSRTDQNARDKVTVETTNKKGVMKGIQVVNAKQAAARAQAVI